jgi:1,4-alpha-glucan branching enzyme
MSRLDSQRVMAAALVVVIALGAQAGAFSQAKTPQAPRGPLVNSPEVKSDGSVVFRILAPKAASVSLQASDIQGLERGGPQFAKDKNGVWEAAVGPIKPGAYRYRFMVDGVEVMDPRNPSVSESNSNA